MKNFCDGCTHWKNGDCEIAYRGAKSAVIDDFEIVVGCDNKTAEETEDSGPKSEATTYKPCSLLWMLAGLNTAAETEIQDGMLRIAKYIDCCRKAGCTLDIDGRLVLPVGSLHTFDSHGADSKLKHRDGDVVQIECLLDDNEYDPAETGLMYSVVFNDGHIGDAFEDELIPGLAERL